MIQPLIERGAPQSEGDIQEAAALWLRGQAAALLAVDRRWSARFREDDDLIDPIIWRRTP